MDAILLLGKNDFGSGIEGAWKPNPTKWDMGYLKTLFKYEWELSKSPAGAHQWHPKDGEAARAVEDAHDPSKRHPPMMTTADLSLEDSQEKFLSDFVAVWNKVMNLDRFDL